MRYFFMPVVKMQERHRKAVGGFVPPDVMKAARAAPEDWYVEWSEGRGAHYFLNTNAIDYDKPRIIEE